MEELRPNKQRAKYAITFIWIILALNAVAIISVYFQHSLLEILAHGGKVSLGKAEAVHYDEEILSNLFLIVDIISAIIFIQWFRRAYFNLHQKIDYLAHSEGWAAGCWFVPVMNVYKPYQIMKELYQETKELLIKKEINENPKLETTVVTLWWALFLINGIMEWYVFLYFRGTKSVHELINGTVAGMIKNAIGIVLALITVRVIKDYSNVEPLLKEVKEEA